MRAFFLRLMNPTDPTISSARFMSITTVLTILYTWMWVSLYTRVVQDIPLGVYTFAGIVVLGKTIGMFAEKTPGSSTLTETTTKTQETTSDSKRTMGKD